MDPDSAWKAIEASAGGEPPTIEVGGKPPRAIMVDPRVAEALLELRARIEQLEARASAREGA